MADSLLLKFQKLPAELKSRASDVDAMHALDRLEMDSGVKLAELVMRVLVQDFEPAKLDEVLIAEYHLAKDKAESLAKRMLDELFFPFRLLEIPQVKDGHETPSPLMPQAGASVFLVHPGDAKDVQTHEAMIQSAPLSLVNTDPAQVLQKIIKMEQLALDEMLTRRFSKIIESIFVDVRDKTETKEMLMRPTKIGGMGFDEPRAGRVMAELLKIVEEIRRRPKPVMAKFKPTPLPPKPVEPPKPVKPLPPPPTPTVVEKQIISTPVVPLVPVVPVKTVVTPPPWVRPSNVPPAQPTVPRPVSPILQKRSSIPSYREVITDVRPPTKAMGPIEALGSLTINDFRRIGATSLERVQKIEQEIEALGQDSFAQKAAGIQAWRQSPVFQTYLTIGRMAMERNEEVTEIIELLSAQGKTTLTSEELEQISQLNRRFRY
jgi:hypothetical protein